MLTCRDIAAETRLAILHALTVRELNLLVSHQRWLIWDCHEDIRSAWYMFPQCNRKEYQWTAWQEDMGPIDVLAYQYRCRYMERPTPLGISECLFVACYYGRHDFAEYLCKTGNMPPEIIQAARDIGCKHGHLEVVKRLSRLFDSQDEIVVRSSMLSAYTGGHVSLLEYFHSEYGATIRLLDDVEQGDWLRRHWSLDEPPFGVQYKRKAALTVASLGGGRSLFVDACALGRLRLAEYLFQFIEYAERDRLLFYRDLFIGICAEGDFYMTRFLQSKFTFTVADIQDIISTLVQEVCKNGLLGLLRLLHSGIGVTAAVLQASAREILLSACQRGDLELIQHLRTEFGFNAKDVRRAPFLAACDRGHRELVEYLCTDFGIRAKDVRRDNYLALDIACQKGHYGVVQYLHLRYGLTIKDLRANNYNAFNLAFRYSHVDVLSYLHVHLGLKEKDIRRINRIIAEKRFHVRTSPGYSDAYYDMRRYARDVIGLSI